MLLYGKYGKFLKARSKVIEGKKLELVTLQVQMFHLYGMFSEVKVGETSPYSLHKQNYFNYLSPHGHVIATLHASYLYHLMLSYTLHAV